MAFVVRFALLALEDIEKQYRYILQQSNDSVAADKWFQGVFAIADTLAYLPSRCKRIPEQNGFDLDLRQLLYESHRLIFHIDGNLVEILRVYHAAGRPLTSLRQRLHLKKLL